LNRKLLISTAALIAGLGIAYSGLQTPNASASYRVVKRTEDNAPFSTFYLKNKHSNAYMWNLSHTKKSHNLKNYPHTTWSRTSTVTLQSGKKRSIYYQVTNGRYNGYVWHGYFKAGQNPDVSYRTNSDKEVVYSSIPKRDWSQVGSETDYTLKKPQLTGLSSYSAYAKKPTTSQINKVVAFIKASNNAAGITGTGSLAPDHDGDPTYNGWQNFRIVMRPISSSKSKTMVPYVEYMTNNVIDEGTGNSYSGSEWATAGTFKAFYDAASATSVKSYDSNKQPSDTGTVIFTPISYALPSYAVEDPYFYTQADKIYTLAKGSLSVVQNGTQLEYVKTANILKFPNQIVYRNGIAYGLADPTRTAVNINHSKATHYRQIDPNFTSPAFNDDVYRNGKWTQNFSVLLDEDWAENVNGGMALKPATIMLTQPSTDPDRIPDFNPPYPVAMGTTTADANTLRNLYAPSSVWAKYLK